MVAQVRYLVVERSRGRVTLCAVCTVHMKTRSVSVLVKPQNQYRQFVSGLASKPLRQFSSVWPQNRWRRFSLILPQNRWLWFPNLCLKTGSSDLMIWVSKSPRQILGLSLKIKQTSICRLQHKTNGGRMPWDTRRHLTACFAWKQVALGFPSLASRLADARRRVVHVAPLQRLRRDQVEDGWVDVMNCVRPCYAYFTVFYVLGPRGIIVF
jgi:hypothetical protein